MADLVLGGGPPERHRDAAPAPLRVEGDVAVVPGHKERLVVGKRFRQVAELHLRRVPWARGAEAPVEPLSRKPQWSAFPLTILIME